MAHAPYEGPAHSMKARSSVTEWQSPPVTGMTMTKNQRPRSPWKMRYFLDTEFTDFTFGQHHALHDARANAYACR